MKKGRIYKLIEETGIHETDVDDAVHVISDYLEGRNVNLDNSELRPWLAKVLSELPLKAEDSFREIHGFRTFPFLGTFNYSEPVLFVPGDDPEQGELVAIVVGCTMHGPKISYHLILESGAAVRTYGDRVKPLPDNYQLDEGVRAFFKEVMKDVQPEM